MSKVTTFGRMSALITVLSLGLAGCAAEVAKEQLTAGILPPVVNPVTEVNQTLRDLPSPSQKIAVAVYNFADQTGQFKPSETTQTLSKAVTQGATSILIKALQDVGEGSWFTVVERERIDNLLKERQIITQMRMTYLGEKGVNPKALPPLLFAAIIFEGGIIGYDSNIQTGGVGARLLGIGGDVKYRLDTITIYLRAVSTKTGQVLASVTTHKTIASIGLQGGVFKFIAVDKILEAEAGFTKNEPDQLAVQQAIEKAVYSMVMEGSEKAIWSFADEVEAAKLIGAYKGVQAPGKQASASLPPSASNYPEVTGQAAAVREPGQERQAPKIAHADIPDIPQKAPSEFEDKKTLSSTVAHHDIPEVSKVINPNEIVDRPWQTSLTIQRSPKEEILIPSDDIAHTIPPTPARRPWTADIATVRDGFIHTTSKH